MGAEKNKFSLSKNNFILIHNYNKKILCMWVERENVIQGVVDEGTKIHVVTFNPTTKLQLQPLPFISIITS